MITTKDWGPKLWYALHTITFNYPDNPTDIDKQNYETFFISLKHVLPCILCQKHYSNHIEKHPIRPNLINRVSLSRWLVDVHNEVNIMLGKPTMTFEEVVKMYKNDTDNKYWKYVKIILVILLIFGGIHLLIKFNFFNKNNFTYKYK